MTEINWEDAKANLDRLTEEALAEIAVQIIHILESRTMVWRETAHAIRENLELTRRETEKLNQK